MVTIFARPPSFGISLILSRGSDLIFILPATNFLSITHHTLSSHAVLFHASGAAKCLTAGRRDWPPWSNPRGMYDTAQRRKVTYGCQQNLTQSADAYASNDGCWLSGVSPHRSGFGDGGDSNARCTAVNR